jgi:hypothetical protein
MIGESHAALHQPSAFAFEEAALEIGEGLADGDSASGGNDAMPGNSLAARAGGHGASRGTSAAREAHRACELAVGDDATFGDALHQFVDFVKSGGHCLQR